MSACLPVLYQRGYRLRPDPKIGLDELWNITSELVSPWNSPACVWLTPRGRSFAKRRWRASWARSSGSCFKHFHYDVATSRRMGTNIEQFAQKWKRRGVAPGDRASEIFPAILVGLLLSRGDIGRRRVV